MSGHLLLPATRWEFKPLGHTLVIGLGTMYHKYNGLFMCLSSPTDLGFFGVSACILHLPGRPVEQDSAAVLAMGRR